jgi:DNA polymerase epsilon subunit 2
MRAFLDARGDIVTKSRAAGKPSIAGAPESRALFLRDRHNIIKQTVLRNENFSPPAFAGRDRTNYLKVRLPWC